MIKKINILIFSLLLYGNLFSQKETANWYFGNYAGITFNTNPPTALTNSSMISYGGCSSISDQNGNLMFYTNGNTIFSKNHDTMLFGSGMLGDYVYGNWGQSVIIVKRPAIPNYYYVFSINRNDSKGLDGLRYTTVSMYLQGGLGAVIGKNHMLLQKTLNTRITAVKHRNGVDVWVIVHEDNSNYFYAFLVTAGGVHMTPTVSAAGKIYTSPYSTYWWNGQIKASPDGKKLALTPNLYGYYYNYSYDSTACEVFDFNDSSGLVSNPIKLKTGNLFSYYYYNSNGIEFSGDGKQLYLTENSYYGGYWWYWGFNIYQYDVSKGSQTAVQNTKLLVGSTRGNNYYYSGLMQLGPDGKIYVAKYYSQYLGVINSPNERGPGCCYQDSGIYLGGRYCWNGLPNYVTSLFQIPDVEFHNTCFHDTTRFKLNYRTCIDSVYWNFGDPSTGVNNTSRLWEPSHIFTAPGTYRVFLKKYKKTAIDTATWFVTIHPLPVARFFVNDSIQCLKGNLFRFTDSSTIATGIVDSFNWNLGEGSNVGTKNAQRNYGSAGTYQVKLIVLSEFGCSATAKKNVKVLPSPTAAYNFNNDIQCLGVNNFVFTNTSNSSNFSNLKFSWQTGDGYKDTNRHISHQYTSADSFFAKLVVTNQFNCKDSVSKMMIVSDVIPDFSVNDPTQCMVGNNFTFTNSTQNPPADSFVSAWTTGDAKKFTTKNIIHSYNVEDTYAVKLVVTDRFGCKDSVSKNVYVYPTPKAQYAMPDNVQCLKGNIFNFTAILPRKNSVLWDFGDGKKDTFASINHSYKTVDSFSIKLLEYNKYGCRDSVSGIVSVIPSPGAAFTVSDSIQCLNGNFFAFTYAPTAPNYADLVKWDFGDLNGSAIKNPFHSYLSADTFLLKLSASNVFKCKDSIYRKMIVHPSANAAFTVNNNTQCFSTNDFRFKGLNLPENTLFNWSFGDGKFSTVPLNAQHAYTLPGMFQVKLKVNNAYQCPDSQTMTVNLQAGPIVSLSVNDSTQCFRNNKFVFNNLTSFPGSGSLRYLWSFGDSRSDSTKNVNHTYNSAGVFKLKLLASYSNSCKDSAEMTLVVYPQPSASFTVNDYTQCEAVNQFLLLNSSTISSGTLTAWWTFGDGNSSAAVHESHKYDSAGIYYIRLREVSSDGCRDSITKKVSVLPSPVALFDMSFDSCSGKVQFINNTLRADSWEWNMGDGFIDYHHDVVHRYEKDGIYQVTLYINKDLMCKSILTQSVNINNLGVYIPTAFSPNGDGINDVFRVENLSASCAAENEYKYKIFNRWGVKVFESSAGHFDWDGTFNGAKVEAGVYYVLLNSISKSYSGTLTVLY